jgi:hypothetical protein
MRRADPVRKVFLHEHPSAADLPPRNKALPRLPAQHFRVAVQEFSSLIESDRFHDFI